MVHLSMVTGFPKLQGCCLALSVAHFTLPCSDGYAAMPRYPFATLRPWPIPCAPFHDLLRVFIPHWAASNPLARARRTTLCQMHWLPLLAPLLSCFRSLLLTFAWSLPKPCPSPFPSSRLSSRVYTPTGRQQPNGASPRDPHLSGGRFVLLAQVHPIPSPSPRTVCCLLTSP